MSKMGALNLELQEQANELGYSTTQEALDNGLQVQYNNDGSAVLVPFLSEEEMEKQVRKDLQDEFFKVLDKIDEAIGYIRFYDHQDSDEHIKNLLEVEEYLKTNIKL